jgi:hypothetical protein
VRAGPEAWVKVVTNTASRSFTFDGTSPPRASLTACRRA